MQMPNFTIFLCSRTSRFTNWVTQNQKVRLVNNVDMNIIVRSIIIIIIININVYDTIIYYIIMAPWRCLRKAIMLIFFYLFVDNTRTDDFHPILYTVLVSCRIFCCFPHTCYFKWRHLKNKNHWLKFVAINQKLGFVWFFENVCGQRLSNKEYNNIIICVRNHQKNEKLGKFTN